MIQLLLAILLGAHDERRLLARVAMADPRALRDLYDRYAGKVLGTARRILGNVGEAEEVVQDTFVDIWNRATSFDAERGSVAAWILTMGRNRAIDRLRSRQARARTIDGLGSDGVAPAPGPDRDAENAEQKRQISAALSALPTEQRAVVELAFYDGLSQSEIAARTGHPLGTIKGRARAAMEKLAVLLREGES